MMDNDGHTIKGTAVKEMEEECGIAIRPGELVDLTKLAFSTDSASCGDGIPSSMVVSNAGQRLGGVPPSQGGCDEVMRLLYLEKLVTKRDLEQMRNRMTGLRHEGEVITLRVVPYKEAWRI